ncbi:MAG: EFR1 family ferrodoxin [Candidatus Hermodarchaeota archaeon]
MKRVIYYFTGTGNSLKIAEELAFKLKNTDLKNIAQFWKNDYIKPPCKEIGFIFPLHFMGLPKIIPEFIKKLDLTEVDYIFTIVTRGSSPGRAITDIMKLLKTKNKKLNLGFKINMPNNYIPAFKIESEKKQQKKFEKANDTLKIIAKKIQNRQNMIKKDNFIIKQVAKLNNSHFVKSVNLSDKKFYIDEKCNSCGICEQICPVNNIKLNNGNPIWQHQCLRCLACLHFCPNMAIQYGRRTHKKGRYHHPDIKFKDIINQTIIIGEVYE